MTKKELEEKCKLLRQELDKAHAELKELQGEKKQLGRLVNKAIGGYINKDTMQWILAEIDFNGETGEASVVKTRNVGSDLAMFNYELNKFVAEQINLRSMR